MKTGSNVKGKDGPVRSNVDDEDFHEQYAGEDGYVIIPPNGGWGWVVVISAFYCNVITDGIQFTFGLFLRKIADYFEAEKSKISLVGSLMFGFHLLVGPVCSGLNNMCGIRPVAVTGSILTAFGLAICYFSPSYQFLYFFYGVLGGVGLGMVYMNTIIVTSLYFTSFRILALGIVVCGTGCGTVVFALLGNELLKIMDWQTSFLVEAALAGSMGTAALTFRPLKPKRILFTTDKALLLAKHSVISRTSRVSRISRISRPSSRFSIFTQEDSVTARSRRATVYIKKDMNIKSSTSVRTIAMEKFAHRTILQELTARVCCCRCECCRRESIVFVHPDEKEEKFEEYADVSATAGTSRSTIIGSVLPGQSTISDSPITTIERKNNCYNCGPARETVRMVLDFKLLRSYAFLMYCVSGGFAMASVLIILIYEKDMSTMVHGFSEDTATYLLVALGAANTFWRLFLGLLSTGVKVNKATTSIVLAIVGSVSMVASTFWANIYFQYSCNILNAMAMASFAVFRPVILIDLVGSDLLINASGISLLFMGVMCIISPPLSGLVMEATNNYNAIFYAAGILHAVSGLLLIKIHKVREYDLKRLQGRIV